MSLVAVIAHYGLAIVIGNVLLEQLGLPLPAVPTLIIAGALTASHRLSLFGVLFGSVAACVAADCAWYWVGARYGLRVLKTLCRISLEPDICVSQTQARFERWGINSLIIAKFVPGLGVIAPPMAGAMRIGWIRFLLLSTCAACLWAGLALGAGAVFSRQIEHLIQHLRALGSIAALGVCALLLAYIGYKWWERRRFYRLLRMARISVAELYTLIEAGAAPVIIDVRSTVARELEPRAIPGALHVPVREIAKHLEKVPRDREIVLYCTCPSEASAARIAKLLMNHGFERVRPLHGGLDAWIAAGHPIAGSSDPAFGKQSSSPRDAVRAQAS